MCLMAQIQTSHSTSYFRCASPARPLADQSLSLSRSSTRDPQVLCQQKAYALPWCWWFDCAVEQSVRKCSSVMTFRSTSGRRFAVSRRQFLKANSLVTQSLTCCSPNSPKSGVLFPSIAPVSRIWTSQISRMPKRSISLSKSDFERTSATSRNRSRYVWTVPSKILLCDCSFEISNCFPLSVM